MKIAQLLLLSCLLLSTFAQIPLEGEPPYNYALARDNGPTPIDVRIPTNLNADLKEIGYSFWLKGDYNAPGMFNFAQLHGNWPSIAAVVDNRFGSCSGAARHRFLALWLSNSGRLDQQPHFHFSSNQKNNGNPWKDMKFPDERLDFDHSWNFISFTYSYVEQKAVARVKFGHSQQIRTLEWLNNDKYVPEALKFRIGGCNDNTKVTFQGFYHDVNFAWSTEANGSVFLNTEQQFLDYHNGRFAPDFKRIKPRVHNVQNGILTRRVGENSVNKWTYGNLDGQVKEYAVWGWCKWDWTNKKTAWHNIYRFSGQKEGSIKDASRIGDRDLVAWVGNGYLHLSTYTFNWHGGHQVNNWKNVKYEDDLTNWFFIYQGYSHKLHKAYAYIKFGEREEILEWDNHWHTLADDATFYLGKDPFYSAFNGDLKDWNVALGDGAYRENNFQELYEKTSFAGDDELDLVEPTEPAPQLYESDMSDKQPAVKFQVPQDELADVQDTSYSFWFRWNFFQPENVNLGAFRGQWLSVAQLSETDKCSAGVNDRWQSVWYQHFSVGEPRLHFTTYQQNTGNWNYWQNMVFEDKNDFDSSWNFLYYGYSHRTQKLFSYVKFGRSGRVQTLDFEPSAHSSPPSNLFFKLGQCNQSPHGFNGHYWNPRLYYKGDNYLGTKEAVDRYYLTSAKPIHFLPPSFTRFEVVGEQQEFDKAKTDPLTSGPHENVQGAEEYAVYGWARWSYIKAKTTWHIVYRHSNWSENKLQDASKYGDRDQVMWVGPGYLHTSTYNLPLAAGGQNWNQWKNSVYEDDLESWFWFYQGYSFEKKKTFFYVKFNEDRVITQVWDNNQHALPFEPRLLVGQDKTYAGFNGSLKNVFAEYGPGAYRETNFEELQVEKEIEPAFDNDTFWQEEAVEEKSDYRNKVDKSWGVIEAPQEALADITEYSFSAYFRFSMSDPQRAGYNIGRSTWRGILGITEKDQFCTHTQHQYRTLALYDSFFSRAGAPSYHFTTYATNKNNANIAKDMTVDDRDIDGSWNWVYFGYSLVEQKSFALVKFGRSGVVRSLTWENIAHTNQIESLKLIYGNCGLANQNGFHGSFYDIRFRYDNMAWKGDEAHALHYLQNSVPAKPSFGPAYTQLPLTDCDETHTQGETLVDQHQFEHPWDFNGAEEYSVYGWAKWEKTPQKGAWHLIFRLTTNEPAVAKNVSNLGDRTLAVWVGSGYITFATYKFGFKAGQNPNSYKNIAYKDDLTSWFFIYYGYDWKTYQARAFVKFQDRTEQITFDNHRHFIPRYMKLYLGKDSFYKAFNGSFRGFNLAVGEGAYRDGEFEELYHAQPSCSQEIEESSITIPSHNSLVGPTQEFLGSEQLILKEDELAEIRKYGFWGWTKWSFRSPQSFGKVNAWHGKCYAIARAVAVKGKGIIVRLCVKANKQVVYRFTDTYANSNVEVAVDQPLEDVVGKWVWVYYAHNQDKQENQAYVFFRNSRQGVHKYQASADQPTPLPRLQFKLGGRHDGDQVWNGYFTGVQFKTGDGAWIKDLPNNIDQFVAEQVGEPETLNKDNLRNNVVFIPVKEENDIDVGTGSEIADSSRFIRDYKDVDEYAVFGWAKAANPEQFGKAAWTFLFRLTVNDEDNLDNVSKLGDRTLCVWIHQSLKFVWVGYDFEFPGNSNINLHDMNSSPAFTVEQLKAGYFFAYMGYSQKLNKIHFYLQLGDGTQHNVPVANVRQLSSSYFGFYLGQDFKGTTEYPQFYGKFLYWHVALGRGAFRDDFDGLEYFKTKIAVKVKDVEEENKDDLEDGNEQFPQEEEDELDGGDINEEDGDGETEQENGAIDQEIQESEQEVNTDDGDTDVDEGIDGAVSEQEQESEDNQLNEVDGGDNNKNGEQPVTSTEGQEGYTSSEEEDNDDDNLDQVPAPEGDCVILYSECGFKGDWENICDKNPTVYIDVKSIYVPEGLRIKLYNLPHFQGKTAIFHETVECIDEIGFQLLQKFGVTIIDKKHTAKSSLNHGGLLKKKTNLVQASIMKFDEKSE